MEEVDGKMEKKKERKKRKEKKRKINWDSSESVLAPLVPTVTRNAAEARVRAKVTKKEFEMDL